MKKVILGVVIALMLLPSVSRGATTADLEAQHIRLLEQIIVLLQAQLQQLLVLRGLPPLQAVNPTTLTSVSTTSTSTPVVVKKKKSGGGGGGGGGSSSGNNNAALAKETACRIAGDLSIAPTETKVAYIAEIAGVPVYASWAPDTTKELHDYLVAYLQNYEATGRQYYTHIPDYTYEYAIAHIPVLESRLTEYYANVQTCGEEPGPYTFTPATPLISLIERNDSRTATTVIVSETELKEERVLDIDLVNGSWVDAVVTSITLHYSPEPSISSEAFISSARLFIDKTYYGTISDGQIVFNNLNIPLKKGERFDANFIIGFLPTVGNYNPGIQLSFWVDPEDITVVREVTNENISIGGGALREPFTLRLIQYPDELTVTTSSSNPEPTVLQLDEDAKSDWYTVFAFDLDTEGSTNNVILNKIPITVSVSSSTYATIVDDAELVIDGVVIDNVTVVPGATTSTQTTLVFEVDGSTSIGANDWVTAELLLRFKALVPGNEGVWIQAEINQENIDNFDVESGDSLNVVEVSGIVAGERHTLRTAGILIEPRSNSVQVTAIDGGVNDYAEYQITVEISAFEQDAYISKNSATSINYTLQDASGSTSISGTRSVVLTSSGEEGGSSFLVAEGATETLTLTVTYMPGVSNTQARLQLNSITFGQSSGTPTGQSWTVSPEEDYRTNIVTIVD